jgi:thiamine-monophosphate kinase
MMDISDGLAIDLGKMCQASGVGAKVYADRIPISDTLKRAADALGTDPVSLAASGGEDYELLMAVRPSDVESIIKAVEEATGTRLTEIGEFIEGSGTVLVQPNGSKTELKSGWTHF